MHPWMERSIVCAIVVAGSLAPVVACAGDDVTVSLTAHRMTVRSDGQETATSADHARPGDLIEYRATYHNTGSAGIRQLAATLPIPPGTEYVALSASPAPTFASRDGRTYEPLPLMRHVRLADGRDVLREVPASEYRSLRWTLNALAAHGEQSVRARVRVSSAVASAQH
jgi:uncharacterized repeat protein (TIGR01451 family)